MEQKLSGQKYAAYEADPGPITGFYDSIISPVPTGVSAIAITDDEWQQAVETHGYTVSNGALVAPAAPTTAQLLAQAQTTQNAVLYAACSGTITSGFSSAALGSACNYPSTLVDQANQNTVAACQSGGMLWCETAGTWSFKAHTQAQAQGVVSSFAAWLNRCQQQLAALTERVNAETTIQAVQGIVWVAPSGS
ncbi:hypothetical protein A8E25_09900 [Burkholderia cenocepacia]|uniref:hypothetical protein n=1 Tax=Burkholderia cenocepacia TaxID=95486 RepID=UPI000980A872|nr:hypothetical protein [Burkholderia cenocepacia]ONR50514.1 hypothetical protein A8E17_33555 [Burkholderia cenocepacia]ONR65121.1 hypothetical protein A8E18_27575 [Burkholderia cenocepacia]ONR74434.1 hypothetical protein A8E23_09595 [Burkholderia cenocepacia]ONR81022.1 hypothetical protein A8E22_14610 [Burkholderia cenocepacia]ONR85877.1 hypothetical protein A8E19_30680 [Burkholderia cenocepacia]